MNIKNKRNYSILFKHIGDRKASRSVLKRKWTYSLNLMTRFVSAKIQQRRVREGRGRQNKEVLGILAKGWPDYNWRSKVKATMTSPNTAAKPQKVQCWYYPNLTQMSIGIQLPSDDIYYKWKGQMEHHKDLLCMLRFHIYSLDFNSLYDWLSFTWLLPHYLMKQSQRVISLTVMDAINNLIAIHAYNAWH